jgi:hypothetical protein
MLGFIAVAVLSFRPKTAPGSCRRDRITILIAGHNEEDLIEGAFVRCAASRPPDEIIAVSDGSGSHASCVNCKSAG